MREGSFACFPGKRAWDHCRVSKLKRTRLQVGVHQLQLVHESHALQQLPRKRLGL